MKALISTPKYRNILLVNLSPTLRRTFLAMSQLLKLSAHRIFIVGMRGEIGNYELNALSGLITFVSALMKNFFRLRSYIPEAIYPILADTSIKLIIAYIMISIPSPREGIYLCSVQTLAMYGSNENTKLTILIRFTIFID